jgi:hypothetical protein
MMRALWVIAAILVGTQTGWCTQEITPSQAAVLVREVVYNELQDHGHHGYWRYWIQRRSQGEARQEEQIETADGPVARLARINGNPLNAEARQLEQARLARLLSSPTEQARHRKEYGDDERRIGRILALLPDAFLYTDAGMENGCRHLVFRPNPDYPAHSVESRVFHAMSGDLWLDARFKHLARLDGHLEENLDFGYGILGRIYKGGWFRLQRTQVGEDWKTERLEVHMTGRAMLFKTIARETSETRGGFSAVPWGLNLTQAVKLLDEDRSANPLITSAAYSVRR